ncbi:MAG: Flp pilus assembly protein CpaB [Eubacteriales bacterium]
MLLSTKSKLWLVLTIVLGIVTSLLVGNYLKVTKTTTENRAMTTVVAAAYGVKQGTRITRDMVKTFQIPQRDVPSQAVTSTVQVIGQLATVELVTDEVITLSQLASEKTSTELSYRIPEGFRAATIAINTLTGVANHVKPGNYVDILMSYRATENIQDNKVLTLTQNSLVLAVGAAVQVKEGDPPTENLTLALTPQEAQLVMLSENIGKMKLVLRPVTDNKKTQLKTIDLKALQAMYP